MHIYELRWQINIIIMHFYKRLIAINRKRLKAIVKIFILCI
jgi:hypothetical protein